MPYLWWQKRKIGEETRSLPLSIDAVESITCLFMSIALLGGLLAEYFFGLWWVDYLANQCYTCVRSQRSDSVCYANYTTKTRLKEKLRNCVNTVRRKPERLQSFIILVLKMGRRRAMLGG